MTALKIISIILWVCPTVIASNHMWKPFFTGPQIVMLNGITCYDYSRLKLTCFLHSLGIAIDNHYQ